MTPLLLIEDDKRLSELIYAYLSKQGFEVMCRPHGKDIEDVVAKFSPKVIILDIMLPGDDGFTICRKLRRTYDGALLFLTAKSSDFDQVIGLELGADDYVIKPVEPRVLLARVQALLRRSQYKTASHSPQKDILEFGKLTLQKQSRQVILDGQTITLTSHEFDMLWMLASHPAELLERDTLYKELIGREYDGLDRSADVRISRLRKSFTTILKNRLGSKLFGAKASFLCLMRGSKQSA